MLSVVIAIHNARERTLNLLRSALRTFQNWSAADVEFLLIDDRSDPQQEIRALTNDFRAQLPRGVKCTELLFTEHQHYTRALAYGFSAARGSNVLFVSHDMVINRDYVRTLLAVSALDARIGLVRGVSSYVDCYPQHTMPPPFPLRNLDDFEAFARYVSDYAGLSYVEDRVLTGDSMLVKRSVLDKIGTFDPRYFGYFGDIDFGLRIQRAGFKMVCAKGAWIWHEGAAAYKDKAERTHEPVAEIHRARMEVVNNAYQTFRQKWNPSLPPSYPGNVDILPLESMRNGPAPAGGEFQPPIQPDPAICIVR